MSVPDGMKPPDGPGAAGESASPQQEAAGLPGFSQEAAVTAPRYFLRPLVALGVTLACYVALQVLAAVFMLTLGVGYALVPSFALAVVTPILLVTRSHSPSIRTTLRLSPVKVAPLVFTVGASFGFVILQYQVAGLLEKLFPMPAWIQEFLLEMTRIRSLAEGVRVVSGVVLAAAVAEEILFRGFLQGSLEHGRGRWRAIILTSLLFAVLHDPWRLVPVFFIGLLLGYLASRGGSIYYSMVAHAVTNATSVAGLNIFGAKTEAEFAAPVLFLPVMAAVFVLSMAGFVKTTRTAGIGEYHYASGK